MGEEEKKPAVAAGKKKYYGRFGGRAMNNHQVKSLYTSNVAELKAIYSTSETQATLQSIANLSRTSRPIYRELTKCRTTS